MGVKVMKITIVKENKTSDKVHAKATYLQDKEGYKRDQAYAIAYQYEEDGKLEEMSAVAGGSVAFGIQDDDKEKVQELLSTSTLKGGLKLKIKNSNKEHDGHVERSKYQGLKNVIESDLT